MAMTKRNFTSSKVADSLARVKKVALYGHVRNHSRGGKGFALLVSIIFMSVMLSIGLALGSLAYKQQVLASSAVESQYAFYAADTALECALYSDQQAPGRPFAYVYSDVTPMTPSMKCDGNSGTPVGLGYTKGGLWTFKESKVPVNNSKNCADVTIYKYPPNSTDSSGNPISTYIFAQGYDVPCGVLGTSARITARGLKAHY
jgi:hypothetical protein